MPVPNALLATLSPGCDLPRGGRPGRRLPCCWPRGAPSSCWSEPPSAGNRLAEEVNVRAKVAGSRCGRVKTGQGPSVKLCGCSSSRLPWARLPFPPACLGNSPASEPLAF